LGTQELVLLFQYQPPPQSARLTAGETVVSEANPTLAAAKPVARAIVSFSFLCFSF
jgi:hypothetical protein